MKLVKILPSFDRENPLIKAVLEDKMGSLGCAIQTDGTVEIWATERWKKENEAMLR